MAASCPAFSPQSALVDSLRGPNTTLRLNSHMAPQPRNEDVLGKPLWMLFSLRASWTKWFPMSRKDLRWPYFKIPSRILEAEIQLNNYSVFSQLFLPPSTHSHRSNRAHHLIHSLNSCTILNFMDFHTVNFEGQDLLPFYTCFALFILHV